MDNRQTIPGFIFPARRYHGHDNAKVRPKVFAQQVFNLVSEFVREGRDITNKLFVNLEVGEKIGRGRRSLKGTLETGSTIRGNGYPFRFYVEGLGSLKAYRATSTNSDGEEIPVAFVPETDELMAFLNRPKQKPEEKTFTVTNRKPRTMTVQAIDVDDAIEKALAVGFIRKASSATVEELV